LTDNHVTPGPRRRSRRGRGKGPASADGSTGHAHKTPATGEAAAHKHTPHHKPAAPVKQRVFKAPPPIDPSNSRPSAPFDPSPLAFASLSIDPALRDALDQRGFVQPTPIQSAVLPYAVEGKDVIGCAQPGTGKTAADPPRLSTTTTWGGQGRRRQVD